MNKFASVQRRFGALLVLILVSCLIAPIVLAQEVDFDAAMDTILANYNNDFTGVILIGVEGEIVFHEAYGLAVREWDVPNTLDAKFLIGSVTNQFTAMAILQLYEQGLLDVDDPICDYLRRCPDTWSGITIHHLMTHTSGIFPFRDVPQFEELMATPLNTREIIELFFDRSLRFEPGTRWEYSPSGYILLGEIIKEASDTSYKRYMTRYVTEPLGLENTGSYTNKLVLSHLATPYDAPTSRAMQVDLDFSGTGNIYSTAEDLFRWNQALYAGEVVSQDTWNMMWERAVENGTNSAYAYGLERLTPNDDEVIWHLGVLPGYWTINTHIVNGNVDVIIFSNMPNIRFQSIYEDILALFDVELDG